MKKEREERNEWFVVFFNKDDNDQLVGQVKLFGNNFIVSPVDTIESERISPNEPYVVEIAESSCINVKNKIFSALVTVRGVLPLYGKQYETTFVYNSHKNKWESVQKSGSITVVFRPDSSQVKIIERKIKKEGRQGPNNGEAHSFKVTPIKGRKWYSPDGNVHIFYCSLEGDAPETRLERRQRARRTGAKTAAHQNGGAVTKHKKRTKNLS